MKKLFGTLFSVLLLALLAAPAFAATVNGELKEDDVVYDADDEETTEWDKTLPEENSSDAGRGIDYLALVNKLNPLPEGWEDALETVTITNSVGDEVEVEKKAYDAYLALKEDLEKNDGIYLELDSARRSVAAQQDIMDTQFLSAANFPANASDGTLAQAAMASVDIHSGAVRAIVGGRKYEVRRGLNRATQIRRQPGSSLKPLAVYAPAIESYGYMTASVLNDTPQKFGN